MKRKNSEIKSISRLIFNKIDGYKKLITLKMLSDDTNNGLKELSNQSWLV